MFLLLITGHYTGNYLNTLFFNQVFSFLINGFLSTCSVKFLIRGKNMLCCYICFSTGTEQFSKYSCFPIKKSNN